MNRNLTLIRSVFTMLFVLLFFYAECQSRILTDTRDGNTYKTLIIGDLIWMAEDLRFQTELSHCPNHSLEECKEANFYSYKEIESVCPEGWRIPVVEDWNNFLETFEDAETVRMMEGNKKLFRVDFLDGYNILTRNTLNIRPVGRTEGDVWQDGYYADYWTTNPEIKDPRFHVHVSQHSISGHAHKHNINERDEEKNRKFAVRCVCERKDN